jgi:crotonobetainyl-CoA:carnitine CoA-transferase CaiB-like acyl-CoA transferase
MADITPAPPDSPMAGVVVIDLATTIAGSYCSKLLADFGARVIKIEAPEGDPLRRFGPFPDTEANPESSGTFLHLNTNKESVVLDLATADGVAKLRTLIRAADIVVETARPGRLAALGLAPADLLADQAALVVASVTAFGQSGPYAGYQMSEIVAFAMGGPMNSSGVPGREPVKLAGNVVQMQSGATALVATLGAYYHALETGEGQHVDVATFETQNGSLDRRRYYLLSYEYSGYVTERSASVGAARVAAGGRFETADGALISTGRVWPTHIGRMVQVLADASVADLWEKKGEALMTEDVDAVNVAIARWAMSRPARGAMRDAQAAGWPVVVVNNPFTLLTDDHLMARGFWVTAPHPVAGVLPYCGPPWRVAGGGWHLRRTAPTLGQDTARVLAELAGPRAGGRRAGSRLEV